MTGRNAGGVGPRRLTGYMAAATILAASLLGLAWANSDKAQEKKDRQQQAASGQPATGSQPTPKATDRKPAPVTRTIGGATVAVDPSTGRLVPPTPEEAAKLTEALYGYVQRDPDSVTVIELEDGGIMANLGDGYEEAAMATRDKKGNIRLHCVNERTQAERILTQGGDGDQGPIYNEKNTKKAEKKAASKAGSPAAETK
jgi:hypothetical protein